MASEVTVLAHGTFDLLHVGHVVFLRHARSLGTRLVVSITADKFVRKGPHRPVFPDVYRAYMLSELRCVDQVYYCYEESGVTAIQTIKPQIYVKGYDYMSSADRDERLQAERDAILALGGRLEILCLPIMYSSTDLLTGKYLQ